MIDRTAERDLFKANKVEFSAFTKILNRDLGPNTLPLPGESMSPAMKHAIQHNIKIHNATTNKSKNCSKNTVNVPAIIIWNNDKVRVRVYAA